MQVQTLERNCEEFGIPVYSLGSEHQGIVHVIGPELGVTQPGMTIVCGDSHTATHGAFGALAFGIGTSEVEHVLATQCLVQTKPKSMRIRYEGALGFGVTAKDLILATIGQIGVDGAVGHVVEYAGPAIEALSMEGRMTVCNMTIEGGGRAGHDRPRRDDVRVRDRPRRGAPSEVPDEWRALQHRRRARRFDREIDGRRRARSARWSPGAPTPRWSSASPRRVPEPRSEQDERALEYMGLEAGTPIEEIKLDRVFIGSCTNSRIGDLRAAAEVIDGPPGRRQRLRDGRPRAPSRSRRRPSARASTRCSRAAGFDWRGAGCSMCLGMNPDIAAPGERVRLDLEPQLRGAPGSRRPHAPRLAADGRGGGDRGPLRRHPGVGGRR